MRILTACAVVAAASAALLPGTPVSAAGRHSWAAAAFHRYHRPDRGTAPSRPASAHAAPGATAVQTSPSWPEYDEIQLVVERGLMPVQGGYFAPSSALTVGTFTDSLHRLQKEYLWRGASGLPVLPQSASRAGTLTREQAVDLLVKALLPASAETTWPPELLTSAATDIGRVDVPYQKSAALAAERLWIPNPLRPTDLADRAFGAALLARAFPLASALPKSGFLQDEIRKALSMHLLYSAGRFPEGAPVTTSELARAISRARMYVPDAALPFLPALPVESTDRRPLTRAQAIAMVVQGLVADSRLNPQLASAGSLVEDPDVRVAFALGPQMYLSKFDDAATIPSEYRGPVAVGVYKGLIPNMSTEPGRLNPNAEATLGYAADLLARSVSKPGDYTGIIIDMSDLKPLERAGGMWVINAGESTETESPAAQIYPSSAHLPVRPFFAAPGALAYYGSINDAERGRAGAHPLVIHALDWARYDWSTMNGDPGLRRGGGKNVPLTSYHFVHGTPPLILLAPGDAARLQELDHQSLLLRTARVALVQPNWSMTAMRE